MNRFEKMHGKPGAKYGIYNKQAKKEEVEQVTYGMTIPEVYQSEPLKAMLAQKS